MKKNTTVQNAQVKIILWIALFMSNFLYAGLVLNMPTPEVSEMVTDVTTLYILVFAALSMLGLSFLLPRVIKTSEDNQGADFTKFVLSLALNESTSIFAFLIAFVFHDKTMSYPLFIVSIIGFILKFPRSSLPTGSTDQGQGPSNKLNAE